jgi:septal ring factor EnvC (AmiA/AmiB activator)
MEKQASQSRAECDALIETHERTMNQFTAQCQTHRSEIQRLSATFASEAEKRKIAQRQHVESKMTTETREREKANRSEAIASRGGPANHTES